MNDTAFFYIQSLKSFLTIQAILRITLVIFLMPSCNQLPEINESKGKPIAKLNESILYQSDINKLIPKGLNKTDSLAYLQILIDRWADNEVFYQQANEYLTDEDLNVEKELEAYKRELISYKFQAKLIDEKLDTNVTISQIEDYYTSHPQNFILKNNIVKVLYIKTPLKIPNLEKLKKLCYSTKPKDADLLKTMCVQYANNFFMNDNTWLMFDDLRKEIPQLKEVPEYAIQKGKTFEFTDATSFYFLKIFEIKSKNTLSPLNLEKNNIKNMLINQRKQLLIKSIKKDFFDKAKTNKELKIYN